MNTAMVVQQSPTAILRAPSPSFTKEQQQLIRKAFLGGASEQEAEVLMTVASRMGLDPFRRQIHFVSRSTQVKLPNGQTAYEDRWAFQVSLQGWRAIAERNPLFEGVDDPIWEKDSKTNMPISCTILAWRSDRRRPAKYTARFVEFAQRLRSGDLTKMWAEKPFLMLEKCAEVNALAKLFPEEQPSDVAELLAQAKIVQADFLPDETGEPAPPKMAGQAEEVRNFLEAINGCTNPDDLENIGNRIAATEIAKSDSAFLRDAYKAKVREFEKARAEASKPMSDEEAAAAVERGEA